MLYTPNVTCVKKLLRNWKSCLLEYKTLNDIARQQIQLYFSFFSEYDFFSWRIKSGKKRRTGTERYLFASSSKMSIHRAWAVMLRAAPEIKRWWFIAISSFGHGSESSTDQDFLQKNDFLLWKHLSNLQRNEISRI